MLTECKEKKLTLQMVEKLLSHSYVKKISKFEDVIKKRYDDLLEEFLKKDDTSGMLGG